MTAWYAGGEGSLTNPLISPVCANEESMRGLPPHVISVDELDPLKDEGIAYFRKLTKAGVSATAQVNIGVTHAASLMFRQALPEVHRKAVREIAAFAKSV